MTKKSTTPKWISTLRTLMEARGYNPRSLSLKAGLNATAVRDMLEGRAKFPRYDTVEALSNALNITPNELMKKTPRDIFEKEEATQAPPTGLTAEDLTLLTNIIEKVQTTSKEYKKDLNASDFAAMISTIFSLTTQSNKNSKNADLNSLINSLILYEHLRKRVNP